MPNLIEMSVKKFMLTCTLFSSATNAVPRNSNSAAQNLADPNYGPVPGQSPLYSSYRGKAPPFPGNITEPILPTAKGSPGADDVVWQNLLSAEWVIFSFYQHGVEHFNAASFIKAGYPNTTYDRIQEIRNNEAGHLRIFQNQISPNSLKPGACRYTFPFYDPSSFLALATVIEISSMAFLTGLVQMAKLPASQGAITAIAETETRHETWSLIDIWKSNPFGGPADAVFPYANEILGITNAFIVPGSCPPENPVYPFPRQNLPAFSAADATKGLQPGDSFALNFTDPSNQPRFDKGKQYYATFFHGPSNISVAIDTESWPEHSIQVKIPPQFEARGVIIAVLTDTVGAPTVDTVKAGPSILLEQPAALGLAVL
ncbi:ferritin-like domain-containing protein [Hirsutella rhossiliensis]|uniref:Ferritin-like domain-containing protein n=1 Tax=Hirsutella rhossiliensis TaxID=111463 RepID=A0A9P8MNH2_9HYPO|nr:ferritin-like domain-containing protein [Hirsutella rhossiliensis]KAH0959443.1 ferritin-like domain-containing protein [Hirsutella rhossiliensis]